MNIFYIYAHPHESSFNAQLKNHAIQFLISKGIQVELSDLYAMHFKAVADWDDFAINRYEAPVQYFETQIMAYEQNAIASDITAEINKIKNADLLIFQFPLWWFSMPAILKGWFDRVFVKKFAYNTGEILKNGLLRGKNALMVITTQSPAETYEAPLGDGTLLDAVFFPMQHILHFVGMETLPPHVIHGAYNMNEIEANKAIQAYENYLGKLIN